MKILFKKSFSLLFFTLMLFTRCRCPKDKVQSTPLKPKKQGGMSVGGGKNNQKMDPVTESTVDNGQHSIHVSNQSTHVPTNHVNQQDGQKKKVEHELNEKLRQMYERVKRRKESELNEICESQKELVRNVSREQCEKKRKGQYEYLNQWYEAGKDKLQKEAYIRDKRDLDAELDCMKQVYKNMEESMNQRFQRIKEENCGKLKKAYDEHNKELIEKLKKKLNQMDDKEDKELNAKLDQWLWNELYRYSLLA